MSLIIAFLTVISTFLGGLFAIRAKDKLHLILGFSAGAVIGVAFFDLLPESFDLASKSHGFNFVTTFIAMGFVIYLLLDRFFSMHRHDDCDHCEEKTHNGKLGAMALVFHSFLDGLGIGLAFKVSPEIGWVVAAAVLAHDFSDGINTVGMILKSKEKNGAEYKWLIADALAPASGVIVTLFFSVAESTLGLVLAIFAGFFLYIGASDLIPESHHQHPTFGTTLMTILGIALLYSIIRLAS